MSNKTSAVVKTNPRKAVMIGCGFVGSASVFALMQSGLFSEIVLIDADKDKAEEEKFRWNLTYRCKSCRYFNTGGTEAFRTS